MSDSTAALYAMGHDNILLLISTALPNTDLIHLASTSKYIRAALAPLVWKELVFGDDERTATHVSWISALSNQPHLLEHTKIMYLRSISPDAIPAIVASVKMMKNLEHFYHEGSAPVPTLVASALCEISTLDCLTFQSHAADSLASFTSVGPLKKLVINCYRQRISEMDMLPHAPITVARHRRTRTAVDPGPTIAESVDAIVEVVTHFLKSSASKIQQLELTHWESGTWLEKLNRQLDQSGPGLQFPCLTEVRISTRNIKGEGSNSDTKALSRFLRSIPAVELLMLGHLDATSPSGPVTPLAKLKTLIFVIEPECNIVKCAQAFWQGSALNDFRLDGIHADFLRPIFAPTQNALALRKLFLRVHSPLGVAPLWPVFQACKNLEELNLFAPYWSCQVIFAALEEGTPHLVLLEFDHPWEKPRGENHPFPYPDGRTIRTDRFEDFKTLAVFAGESVESTIVSRIQEDIAAVKPKYAKHMTKLAKSLPKLRTIVWKATQEVIWTWNFTRKSGNLKFRQKAVVTFMGDADEGTIFTQTSVLVRSRRGTGGEGHGCVCS